MKLTVKDLIRYLSEQNPEAKICFYDSKLGDYAQLEDCLFKKVSKAKKDYRANIARSYDGLNKKDRKIAVEEEMREMFKFVEDDDILIGLKNNSFYD